MGLPGLPTERSAMAHFARRARWHKTDKARPRAGRGGGLEYHFSLLPPEAKIDFLIRSSPPDPPEKIREWKAKQEWFMRLLPQERAIAERRLQVIDRFNELERSGMNIGAALAQCEREFGVAKSTIRDWRMTIRGVHKHVRITYLVPKKRGPQRADHG
jgi:hypothetical protein